jgi:hypothetical protein
MIFEGEREVNQVSEISETKNGGCGELCQMLGERQNYEPFT